MEIRNRNRIKSRDFGALSFLGVFQRPLTLILRQKHHNTNGSRIVTQPGVFTTFCQGKGIQLILLQEYRDRNGRCIAIGRGPPAEPRHEVFPEIVANFAVQSRGNFGLKCLLKFFSSLNVPAKLRRKLRQKLRPELPPPNGNFAHNSALQKPFANIAILFRSVGFRGRFRGQPIVPTFWESPPFL